jgi:hypothetical protein
VTKPVIVTGCGRSGTHWLGNIMEQVLGEGAGAHEPTNYTEISDVVVDSRLRHHVLSMPDHRIVHLVRDGRDVVRSLHKWYDKHRLLANPDGKAVRDTEIRRFRRCCREWSVAVDLMHGYPLMRLEDLLKPGDPQTDFTLPHWSEWDENMTTMFWELCGNQMKRMGYDE